MPTTTLGLVYPASTDNVQLWTHLQTLAESVDTLVAAGRAAEYQLIGERLQTAIISSTSAGGHVETFGATGMITATLTAGAKYKVTYSGAALGAAGDGMYMRMRYKAGATVDSAGTQLAGGIKPVSFAATGYYVPVMMVGTFTAPSSAQYTVGISADHYFGGANDASLYYSAGGTEPILLLERVKV